MDIVLLGPPGAGKGTQGGLLAEWLGVPLVSSGELFRDAMERNTELGRRARRYIESGEYVPDDVTIGMVRERLGRPDCTGGAILDGFPRTVPQAEALDRLLAEMGRRVDAAALIQVPVEELVRRLGGRWTCASCGAVYHEDGHPSKEPGVCDECGGRLERREDDAPEVQRRRIEVYNERAGAVIAHYRERGVLEAVDGRGDVDAVQRAMRAALLRRLERGRSGDDA